MSSTIYGECESCPIKKSCGLAVQPGSMVCMVNRMRSGMTKEEEKPEFCPHCGRRIK